MVVQEWQRQWMRWCSRRGEMNGVGVRGFCEQGHGTSSAGVGTRHLLALAGRSVGDGLNGLADDQHAMKHYNIDLH